jgi:hypothetical protein
MESSHMKNIHTRHFAAPIEEVRVWIAEGWTGGDRDCFPHDVIPSWRRNPAGIDPAALVPGQTMLGHGPFQFRLREWDGFSWKVDILGDEEKGWHGFNLAPEGDGCHVTHTLSFDSSAYLKLKWLALTPIHDWAVEALFDRMEYALRTGVAPRRTERPMPVVAAMAMRLHRARRMPKVA